MVKRSRARSQESIEFARTQRRTENEFAATIWQWIRNRKIDGTKFRREYPIPPYTIDFCCVERKLIIEIDGEGHFTEEGLERDRMRDRFLRNLGYKILRLPGYAVIRENGNVITKIREFVPEAETNSLSPNVKNPSPPAPLPEAGRGE